MPESKTNTHTEDSERSVSSLPAPPPRLLMFRKPLIIFTHIITFAVSLLLSFLLAYNMRFSRSWVVGQYPILLAIFRYYQAGGIRSFQAVSRVVALRWDFRPFRHTAGIISQHVRNRSTVVRLYEHNDNPAGYDCDNRSRPGSIYG